MNELLSRERHISQFVPGSSVLCLRRLSSAEAHNFSSTVSFPLMPPLLPSVLAHSQSCACSLLMESSSADYEIWWLIIQSIQCSSYNWMNNTLECLQVLLITLNPCGKSLSLKWVLHNINVIVAHPYWLHPCDAVCHGYNAISSFLSSLDLTSRTPRSVPLLLCAAACHMAASIPRGAFQWNALWSVRERVETRHRLFVCWCSHAVRAVCAFSIYSWYCLLALPSIVYYGHSMMI